MTGTHPYISGPGNIAQMVAQLRKAFPPTVDSNTVKKLGLASNNESYVINALQFLNILDSEGKKTKEATNVFSNHKDDEFSKSFGELVKKSYSDLFEIHGDTAWTLDKDNLITFFRKSDDTSAVIGGRQAGTFQILAALSGHGEIPTKKESAKKQPPEKKSPQKSSGNKAAAKTSPQISSAPEKPDTLSKHVDVGLTVRIEINLPGEGSKETYDNIFKSIKENIINA